MSKRKSRKIEELIKLLDDVRGNILDAWYKIKMDKEINSESEFSFLKQAGHEAEKCLFKVNTEILEVRKVIINYLDNQRGLEGGW